jgi:hypothetical protein
MLQGVVDLDFRTQHYKALHGLQHKVLSHYDKSIKAKASMLAFSDASKIVAGIDGDGKVQVVKPALSNTALILYFDLT